MVVSVLERSGRNLAHHQFCRLGAGIIGDARPYKNILKRRTVAFPDTGIILFDTAVFTAQQRAARHVRHGLRLQVENLVQHFAVDAVLRHCRRREREA